MKYWRMILGFIAWFLLVFLTMLTWISFTHEPHPYPPYPTVTWGKEKGHASMATQMVGQVLVEHSPMV